MFRVVNVGSVTVAFEAKREVVSAFYAFPF